MQPEQPPQAALAEIKRRIAERLIAKPDSLRELAERLESDEVVGRREIEWE